MTNSIRVIAVDDEPLARANLRVLLEGVEGVELIAECAGGAQAIEAVEKLRPDLLFLDIKMPQIDGFEVIRRVGSESAPHVVFVTAFDEYAVKAFELNALDYLLKPFDDERFHLTLARAKEAIGRSSNRRGHEALSEYAARVEALANERPRQSQAPLLPPRLVVRERRKVHYVEVEDIWWIEAAGSYVRLHTTGRTLLLRRTLASLLGSLESANFSQIHRSSMVNLARVEAIQPLSRGDCLVVLKNGTELRGSRRYRRRLVDLLGR